MNGFHEEYWRQRMEEEKTELESNAEQIKLFIEYAKQCGISESTISFSYVPKIGVVATSPKIVQKLISDLSQDRDGLYSTRDLTKVLTHSKGFSGSLRGDRFIIMFSHYFRRGFHNESNWAPRFVDVFWQHYKDTSKKCFIRLDEDRVRINLDGRVYLELDTWYGPKYSDKIEAIQDGNTKLSIPLDLPIDFVHFLFRDVQAWDLSWSTRGNIKTFQAMEFKTNTTILNIDSQKFHPVRYLHSEYDLNTETFYHVDGAILLLNQKEYEMRSTSDFNLSKKTSFYIKPKHYKLFKVNGIIDVSEWIDLVSHFFHGNLLVHEYFTGALPEGVLDAIAKIRSGS